RLFELVFIDEFSPRNDRLTSAKLLSSPAVSKSNDIERPEIRSAILYLLSEQIKKPHIVAVIVEQELTARKSGNKRLFFFRFVSFFHEIHDKSKRHIHYVVYLHAIFHQISYKIVHVLFLLFRCRIFCSSFLFSKKSRVPPDCSPEAINPICSCSMFIASGA